MSQCRVPNWNLRQQRQEGEEGNRSPHVQSNQSLTYVVPMSDYEVTELRWENGQVAMNGLGHEPSSKQTWGSLKSGDTLESLVHQATLFPVQNDSNDQWRQNPSLMNMNQSKNDDHKVKSLNPILPISSSGAKWNENIKQNEIKAQANPWRHIAGEEKGLKNSSSGGKYGHDSSPGGSVKNKKAINGENNYCMMRKNSYDQEVEEGASGRSGCASESATFCRDQTTDTTMMTWPSFESLPISSSHAASENQDGPVLNGESFRSQSSARSSRAAAVHNQSERRRRDRINQKMKALQKLVPNASKTDKASMLDEVIEYLKQLQTQIRMMSNARSIMPQMMMPLGMQQQIQMSYLARMGIGMGMGMGMVDVNNLARNTLYPIGHAAPPPLGGTAPFLPPSFSMPPVVPPPSPLKANVDAANAFVPNFGEAYKTLLAQQSMNMDFFNKVAALYGQQTNQQSDKPINMDNGLKNNK